MPPCDREKCGLNPTFICEVAPDLPPIICFPKGLVPPTGPKDGLVPSYYELEPEKARPTFCGPSGVLAFQFHLKERLKELLRIALGL